MLEPVFLDIAGGDLLVLIAYHSIFYRTGFNRKRKAHIPIEHLQQGRLSTSRFACNTQGDTIWNFKVDIIDCRHRSADSCVIRNEVVNLNHALPLRAANKSLYPVEVRNKPRKSNTVATTGARIQEYCRVNIAL